MSVGALTSPLSDGKSIVGAPALEVASQLSTTRFPYAVLIALGVHGLLILGIGYKLSLNPHTSSSIEITLATHKDDKAPEKADFLAQHNQKGSGSEEVAKEVTSESISEFASNTINDVSEAHTRRSAAQALRENTLKVDRAAEDKTTAGILYQKADVASKGDSAIDQDMSQEVASLKAKLDKQRQAYAKRPRVRRLTSVSTRSSDDAKYLLDWSQQVEMVGNRNYPQKALAKGIHGELRLLAVIDVSGALVKAEVLQSSGYNLLDDAALNIVHKAAPYAPFPPSIRRNTDHIEIIRTWRFEISGFSTQ